MRRVVKVLLFSAAVALVWAPTPARADGFISPFLGVNFGNNSGNNRGNYGVDATWMGKGIIGAEGEWGWAPGFFGNAGDNTSNYVTDVMGNLIVGIPIGGTYGSGVRPYGTIGAGLIRTQTNLAGASNQLGLDAGAGVMGFMGPHVGLRGDVRYFRNLSGNLDTIDNIDFGAFHFWRASIGIVLR